ncbi:MAG: hypothetical protein R2715_01915 [Ilumatobacteraceae bacterium]
MGHDRVEGRFEPNDEIDARGLAAGRSARRQLANDHDRPVLDAFEQALRSDPAGGPTTAGRAGGILVDSGRRG